jgi:hypothetical protein
MTLDLKDFYLMTPVKRYKYFCMKLDVFPQDIIDKYNLTSKVDHNGNVHCKVRQGMYGLPQAGIIAQELLEERLKKAGYTQSKLMPGYWKQKKASHQFHTRRGRLWRRVHWKGTRHASHQYSQGALQS